MAKAKKFPFTQEYLRSVIHYNKKTGVFTWRYDDRKPANWNTKYGAMIAGSATHQKGYISICITYEGKKIKCLAHRLAWFYVYGEQPDEIDHEDTITNHNWIDNLRPANTHQNQCNTGAYANNTSGYKGVTWAESDKRWKAQISVKGRNMHLGNFKTPEAASKAYIAAAMKYHKKFARWEHGNGA